MQTLASRGLLGFGDDAYLRTGQIMPSAHAAIRLGDGSVTTPGRLSLTAARVEDIQLGAQFMLLVNTTDDAMEHFEQHTKHVSSVDRSHRYSRACLIAGLQGLSRNQVRSAWHCFKRILDTKGVPVRMQVEAAAALATLYFSLGMRHPASIAVQYGLGLLEHDDPSAVTPRSVLRTLQTEFMALDLLRRHPSLEDLAFWPRQVDVVCELPGLEDVLERVAECRNDAAPYAMLVNRLDFLERLLRIAYETSASVDQALTHVSAMECAGLGPQVYGARHELALACVASGQLEWLRKAMLWREGSGRAISGHLHDFEFEYCLAKLGELRGNNDEYIAHFRKYSVQALIHVRRSCAYIGVPSALRQRPADVIRDDVSSRLPARYRRAYQFILTNLPRRELSVREVADSIGVTERALQLAFREHIGLSPSALIRRCRLERIRGDLSDGAAAQGRTALAVAQRWGLGSRSALTSAYQSAFGESPSRTEASPEVV